VDLPFTDYGKGLRAAERIVDIIAEALTNYYGPDFETRNYDQRNIVTGLLTQKVMTPLCLRLNSPARVTEDCTFVPSVIYSITM